MVRFLSELLNDEVQHKGYLIYNIHLVFKEKSENSCENSMPLGKVGENFGINNISLNKIFEKENLIET